MKMRFSSRVQTKHWPNQSPNISHLHIPHQPISLKGLVARGTLHIPKFNLLIENYIFTITFQILMLDFVAGARF